MSHNPYASPSATNAWVLPSPNGAFHDNGSLVVPQVDGALPPYCLKTGVPTEESVRLEGKYLPRSSRLLPILLGGAVGYEIARQSSGKPVSLSLPLCSKWVQRNDEKKRWSWLRAALGLIPLLVGMALAYWNAIFVLLGVVGTVVVYVLARKDAAAGAPFTVYDVRDGWVWIRGVNPEIAEQFPPLPIEGPPKFT